jgi:WD40 repeat protein
MFFYHRFTLFFLFLTYLSTSLADTVTAPIRTFPHLNAVEAVAFSPDGHTALVATQGTLKHWDILTGQLIQALQGHTNKVTSVAFSQTGNLAVSGDQDGNLKLWNILSGQSTPSFQVRTSSIEAVAFSPDERFILSGDLFNGLILWNAQTGQQIRTFQMPISSFSGTIAFSPDGQSAIAGNYIGRVATLKLWNVQTGQVTRTFNGHSDKILAVSFSSEGNSILSGSEDHTIKLWNVNTGQTLHTFTGHTGPVNAVAFSPDGHYALSGSDDKTIKLWDIKNRQEIRTFRGHTGPIHAVVFSSEQLYALSGSRDTTMMLWETSLTPTFNNVIAICEHLNDEGQCKELRDGKRAAILIHPNGQTEGVNQAKAINFMAHYAYKTLHEKRGFTNEEIYFLSHKPDIADNIVDAPVNWTTFKRGTASRDVTVADIRTAFRWAKEKGPLNYPLIVIFVDHGADKELILSDTQTLSAQVFKAILDDYQNITGNQIVVILEACHTGTLVPILAGPNRIIMSSTGENLAYYDELGETSFLKLYFDQLGQGDKFGKALATVKEKLSNYSSPFNQQQPQLNDQGGLSQLCLNGCWGALPGILTLTVEELPPIVPFGQPFNLIANTRIFNNGYVQTVMASLLTPSITFNEFGYPLHPPPIIEFKPFNTRLRDNKEHWQGQVLESELTTPGMYTITVKAKDNNGFITEEPRLFCVESCQPAQLTNISTRAPILGGANNVIAGFIIEGTGTQKIVLRGWGLETSVDPMLTLQEQLSNGSWQIKASNNTWQRDAHYQKIPSQMTNAFEANDAALFLELAEGVYTLNLSSLGQTGRGLVGVDAIDSNQNIKLINLSTRAPIKGGANNVVAGFIIEGTGTQKIVLRGWGLEAGVDPMLTLQKQLSNGSWQIKASNNNWQRGARYTEIPDYMIASFEANDAALLLDLQQGVYTVTLSSVGAHGLGLIGVDALD